MLADRVDVPARNEVCEGFDDAPCLARKRTERGFGLARLQAGALAVSQLNFGELPDLREQTYALRGGRANCHQNRRRGWPRQQPSIDRQFCEVLRQSVL